MTFIDWLLGESSQFQSLMETISHVEQQGELIMTKIEEIQAAQEQTALELQTLKQTIADENAEVQGKLNAHVEEITALTATIADLNAQLAAGGVLPTTALDSLLTNAQAILATAQGLKAGVQGISEPVVVAPVDVPPAA